MKPIHPAARSLKCWIFINGLLRTSTSLLPIITLMIPEGMRYNAANYSRDDNPYLTPESAGDLNMFRGIAQYNLIGNFFFGVNYIADENCIVRPEYEALVENFRCVSSAIPLLLKYQGTGKVHAIIQEYKQSAQYMDFDGWMGNRRMG